MANIGVLTVDMRLLSKKFEAGVKRANMGLTKMRAKASAVTKSMRGLNVGIAGALGVAGMGAMISQSLKSADAISKMSDRLNISTESLSAFNHMAELNGSSVADFEKSITKMSRSIGEAERGTGTGKEALEDLGITLDMLSGKSADQQFLMISDALKDVKTSTLQASLASDIFGRSGVDMLNTITAGRDGFESASAEVDKFGLSLSRIDGSKVEAANDAMLRAKQVMKGAALTAAVQLSPYLEEIANQFVTMGTKGEGFAGFFKNLVINMVVGWGHVSNAMTGLIFVFDMIKLGLHQLGLAWATALEFIQNDVIVPWANKIADVMMAPIRNTLEFIAEYSDAAADMLSSLDGMNPFQQSDGLKMLVLEMKVAASQAKADMYQTLSEIVPVDEIRAKMDGIFTEAETRAEAAVAKIQDRATVTYDDEPETEEEKSPEEEKADKYDYLFNKEKSFQEKIAQTKISSSKKVGAVQKALALKSAIVEGFSAIQKAWGSAPFPANIPIVALTGAAVAANIQGIRGQAHAGIDYVPREGTWLLDKGERVVDSRTNADLKGFLMGGGMGGGGGSNYNVTVNASGGGSQSYWNQQAKMITKAIAREERR